MYGQHNPTLRPSKGEPLAPPVVEGLAPGDRVIWAASGTAEVTIESADGSWSTHDLRAGDHAVVEAGRAFCICAGLNAGVRALDRDDGFILKGEALRGRIYQRTCRLGAPKSARSQSDMRTWLAWSGRQRELQGELAALRPQREALDARITELEVELAEVERKLAE